MNLLGTFLHLTQKVIMFLLFTVLPSDAGILSLAENVAP